MNTILVKVIEYTIENSSSIEAYFHILSYNLNNLLKKIVNAITGTTDS